MARHENPPFPRGQTGSAYTDAFGTLDATGLANLEGMEWEFEDYDYSTNVAGERVHSPVICRCVRNVAGSPLLPKRVAKFKSSSTDPRIYGNQVDGYATIGLAGGVVDEFLPAAGVPNNELFWLVVDGPTKVTTDTTGDTTISVGSMVIPGTTADGTVIDQDTSVAAGAATFAQVNGALGRCRQAVATTATDFMITMRRMGA
jgi:hypothetical protein